ncbi:GNAT family N-acetyltransferase, cg3035/Rv0428c family [Gordonia liuliyuniae]|uniref:GCN5 family acetyltransferase n=1 Tax=Gordonia liuliyuniae TaxID=2911517 RepID=A0ABS9ISX4_9ACTN|nr:GCN5 family acetyltransferase [Gordonia liuliyuniae]MCF8588633.1 GCN5 family acetyltransferase [Gordonia liuliyuniae]
MIDPTVGDRIVVRYRLDQSGAPSDWRAAPNPTLPTGPSQSDVTGVLALSDEQSLKVDRDGEVVSIPRAAITSIRLLSRRVVRNSEIRDVERALCAGCDATHRSEIDGWLVSAGGSTLRGRSAVPVEFNAPSAAVAQILDWYADLDEPALALLPDRLVRPGRIAVDDAQALEVLVGAAPAPPVGLAPVRVGDALWAVDVDAADEKARAAARAAGYELHHTVTVGELVEP